MPIYSLQQGVKTTILQNQVVALPARIARLQTSAAVEYGASDAGPFTALTGANTTGVETSGGFIRCTTAACDALASV